MAKTWVFKQNEINGFIDTSSMETTSKLRFWVRFIVQKRTRLSEFFTLVKELRDGDHEGY